MSVNQNTNVAYSLNQPLSNIFPAPIASNRAPLTTDKAPIGTVWVQKSTNDAWILTSIVSNSATWSSITGGSGVFSTLTVTGATHLGSYGGIYQINADGTGNAISLLTGDQIVLETFNSASTISLIGSGANNIVEMQSINGTGIISCDNGIQVTTANGPLAIKTGTGLITISADAAATTLDIGTGAAAKTVVVGSTTAGSTLTLNTPTSTPVAAANGLTATVGNITTTNGNVVLSTAATYLQLPGPIKIMSGAGAPSNGLATEAGDLYIRTDPAGATSRIYVATAASTWTNVTCAA